MILTLYFLTILLYSFSYYIFSHIKSYDSDDYNSIPAQHRWETNKLELKEGAIPKRGKIKGWVIICAIIAFFIPIVNIIAGVVLAVVSFSPLEMRNYKYFPGKITGSIYNFFHKIFSKEF